MPSTAVVVIGAGQAGLAVSRVLTDLAVEHVVLERGAVADRWRTRGWDSLTLLTPRWMSRLPHWRWAGPDPHGYMTRTQVIDYLVGYSASFPAPVVEQAEVLDVRATDDGRFAVTSTAGRWTASDVVVATGHCAVPRVPRASTGLAPSIHQTSPDQYRNPGSLPDGGVLVVGASASGAQIADELREAGREVVLAVGRHTRLPRRYRGHDVLAWLSALGVLDRSRDTLRDPTAPPDEPSLQLVGRVARRDVDLASLQRRGVTLTGRLLAANGTHLRLAEDLAAHTRAADATMARLLRRIDALADRVGAAPSDDPVRRADTAHAPTELDLGRSGVGSVVWATGYRRSHPWLHLPVLDPRGDIVHRSGHAAVPGLHVVGTPWQTRRSSVTLDGVRHDAVAVARRIAARQGIPARDTADLAIVDS